jgi:hypothetical protein
MGQFDHLNLHFFRFLVSFLSHSDVDFTGIDEFFSNRNEICGIICSFKTNSSTEEINLQLAIIDLIAQIDSKTVRMALTLNEVLPFLASQVVSQNSFSSRARIVIKIASAMLETPDFVARLADEGVELLEAIIRMTSAAVEGVHFRGSLGFLCRLMASNPPKRVAVHLLDKVWVVGRVIQAIDPKCPGDLIALLVDFISKFYRIAANHTRQSELPNRLIGYLSKDSAAMEYLEHLAHTAHPDLCRTIQNLVDGLEQEVHDHKMGGFYDDEFDF